MAVLLVAVAVMLVLMTMAMPVWRQQARREREEELLFRLKQYAHALALFQRQLPGAAPASVDDLVKQKFLRKKYTDPITGKDFAILRVGQVSPGMTSPMPGVNVGPGTGAGSGGAGNRSGSTTGPGGTARPGVGGPSSLPGAGGIRGVVSTSTETSLRVWKGRTRYDQWEVAIEDVTPRMLGTQAPQPGQQQRSGAGRTGTTGTTSPSTGRTQVPANPYGRTITP